MTSDVDHLEESLHCIRDIGVGIQSPHTEILITGSDLSLSSTISCPKSRLARIVLLHFRFRRHMT